MGHRTRNSKVCPECNESVLVANEVGTKVQDVRCQLCWQLNKPFLSTVPTFAVQETDVSWHNGGTSGAPLKPLRDDGVLRALSSQRGLRGAPEV